MSKVLYWECNQRMYDSLRKRIAPGSLSMSNARFSGIELRVNDSRPDGWFPIYDGEGPRWDPCCPIENRSFTGGCLSCGDPSL